MIAIIGATGFIGGYLQAVLQGRGLPLKLFDKAFDETCLHWDVTEPLENDELKGVNTIINLAAEHRDDVEPKSKYYDVNVRGAVNVCDAAREAGVNRIIFTSSVAVYGFAPPGTDETGMCNFFNEYGRTKLLAEDVYRQWQNEDPLVRSLVIVRPTAVFGAGNRGNVHNLINKISKKRFIMLGNGENVKSIAYVENVVAFLAHCLSSAAGVRVHNYIDIPELTMKSLVDVIHKQLFSIPFDGWRLPAWMSVFAGWMFDAGAIMLQRPLPVSGIRVRKFMATTQFSSNVSEFGFIAPYDCVDGLIKTIKADFSVRKTD